MYDVDIILYSMCIYNDCKIVIDLNKLVKARPCGVDLADEHVDNIANDFEKENDI